MDSNDDNLQRQLQLNSEFSQFHLVSGQEIQADEVIKRLDETIFKDPEGEAFPETEQVNIERIVEIFAKIRLSHKETKFHYLYLNNCSEILKTGLVIKYERKSKSAMIEGSMNLTKWTLSAV